MKHTKTVVKSPVEVMQELVKAGYFVARDGSWIHDNTNMNHFVPEMWHFCGKEPCSVFYWLPEWLEEVE